VWSLFLTLADPDSTIQLGRRSGRRPLYTGSTAQHKPLSLLTPAMTPQRRLNRFLSELMPAPEVIGTLKLGDITYEVPASLTPSRLPKSSQLLDVKDPVNLDNLHFMLQKYLLGQDVFLVSQPGPYARRMAMTFAR
jgi:hypothetical protein